MKTWETDVEAITFAAQSCGSDPANEAVSDAAVMRKMG